MSDSGRSSRPYLQGFIIPPLLALFALQGWAGTLSAQDTAAGIPGPPCPTDASRQTPISDSAGQSKRPNLLLIGIETLRADHVGCLGYRKDTSPTIDRLAREGVLCTNAISTSGWTLPSVMSVMTSLYPSVHRVQTYEHRLAGETPTLAKILKAAGYAAFAIVSNPTLEGTYGFAEGYDLYDDFTAPLDFGADMFGSHDGVPRDRHLSQTSALVTKVAGRWLENRPQEPFFLFAFYFDPHYDYIPPPPFDTLFDPNYDGSFDGRKINEEPRRSQRPSDRDLQHLLALYDGEIRYTDTYVGELLHALDRSGASNDTLVVLFGDHGDEFYEHGKTAHSRTLYREIVHVPLIFRWPGRLPAGRRVDAVASLVDVMPTILDYLKAPCGGPMQGISLRPLIEGTPSPSRDTVWAELMMENHIQAAIRADCGLFRNVRSDTWELYCLPSDPGEHLNVYDQPSAQGIRVAMTTDWTRWIENNERLAARLAQGTKAEPIPPSEQQLERLKALGYVQ